MVKDHDAWLAALSGDRVHTEQDRKSEFRRFLANRGAVSQDQHARQFKKLLKTAPGRPRETLYDLRHAVTQAMKDSGMPHLDLRYLTSHATSDILNAFTSPDVDRAMGLYFAAIPTVLDAIGKRPEALLMNNAHGQHPYGRPLESNGTERVMQ